MGSSTIKPPNDVYLAERKVAGVLVETKAGLGDEFTAIAGLGVNINQALEDFPIELRERAGSLAMALGRQVDRAAFAVALLRELDRTRALINRDLPAIAVNLRRNLRGLISLRPPKKRG